MVQNFSRASRAEKILLFRTQIVKKRLFLRVKQLTALFGTRRAKRAEKIAFLRSRDVTRICQDLGNSSDPPLFRADLARRGGHLLELVLMGVDSCDSDAGDGLSDS